MRRTPMRYADMAALWGEDASSDLIRQRLRCRRCGHKGVATYHPGWTGLGGGWEAWPGMTRGRAIKNRTDGAD
jgi:hypothetical protein